MKNRKLFIIGFLVVATLVTGVGFAALTGSLDVSGTARFIGSGTADFEIRNAINFTKVQAGPANVVATLTNVSNNVSKTADMTVEFHDLDASVTGEDAKYSAYADFTIQYGDENVKDVLPVMNLCALEGDGSHVATVSLTNSGNVSGTFAIQAYWVDKEGNPMNDTIENSKGMQQMRAGETRIMRVVITYVEDTIDHPSDSFSANIVVTLPFHTTDNTSNSGSNPS